MDKEFYNVFGIRYAGRFNKTFNRPVLHSTSTNVNLNTQYEPTIWENKRLGYQLETQKHRDNSYAFPEDVIDPNAGMTPQLIRDLFFKEHEYDELVPQRDVDGKIIYENGFPLMVKSKRKRGSLWRKLTNIHSKKVDQKQQDIQTAEDQLVFYAQERAVILQMLQELPAGNAERAQVLPVIPTIDNLTRNLSTFVQYEKLPGYTEQKKLLNQRIVQYRDQLNNQVERIFNPDNTETIQQINDRIDNDVAIVGNPAKQAAKQQAIQVRNRLTGIFQQFQRQYGSKTSAALQPPQVPIIPIAPPALGPGVIPAPAPGGV